MTSLFPFDATRPSAVAIVLGLAFGSFSSPFCATITRGAESESRAGSQFTDWGISFTAPALWRRWPTEKERTLAAKALQSADDATLKVKLVHLGGRSATDEAASMLLTVVQERSGRTLLLSDVLERQRRDDNRAKEYGDAAQINRLEISKAAGLECVVHDVTLRRRARMLSYNFVFGPQQVTVRWLFRDSAGFAEFKPAVDGVLRTFAFSGDPKDPNPHPVEIDK